MLNRSTRRFAAWLAVFAMLLAALAPTVSHALSPATGGTIEVCSVDGPRSIPDPDAPAPAPHNALEHCPFCATQAGSFALPNAPLPAFDAPRGDDVPPPPVAIDRPAQDAPLAARPRAPPAFS